MLVDSINFGDHPLFSAFQRFHHPFHVDNKDYEEFVGIKEQIPHISISNLVGIKGILKPTQKYSGLPLRIR